MRWSSWSSRRGVLHRVLRQLEQRLGQSLTIGVEDTEGDVVELPVPVAERAGLVEGVGDAFAVDGGRLSLVDVVVADGWDRRMDDESAEEIEFSLRSGDERWDVEIELDDGAVEPEMDYRLRSGATR